MNFVSAFDRLCLQISIDIQPSIEVIGTHPRPFNVLSLPQKKSKCQEYRTVTFNVTDRTQTTISLIPPIQDLKRLCLCSLTDGYSLPFKLADHE